MDTNHMQVNQNQVMYEQLENMYPEIYNDIYPLVVQSANDIIRNVYAPTNDMINYHIDNIIKTSGMWDEDDDTVAVTAQSGFDPRPSRRHRRGHHNRNTLRDITRILLLRELRDRNRRHFY